MMSTPIWTCQRPPDWKMEEDQTNAGWYFFSNTSLVRQDVSINDNRQMPPEVALALGRTWLLEYWNECPAGPDEHYGVVMVGMLWCHVLPDRRSVLLKEVGIKISSLLFRSGKTSVMINSSRGDRRETRSYLIAVKIVFVSSSVSSQ